MNFLRSAPRKIWWFLDIINSIVPKNEKKIFIYSNLGFRDNVKAIYDHLVENGYNEEYKIICSLNDHKSQRPLKNVKFMGNFRGLFSFFVCRYAFYCFGKYPVKPKRDQKVFNLWHGMPLKRIGNMVSGFEKTDYNYFTHILCTSEFFRGIMKKSFSCDDNQIVICGQPRTDEMLRSLVECKNGEKLLLWLPTFRSGDNCSELGILSQEQFMRLDILCEEYGWKVLIKLHPLSQADTEKFSIFKNIKAMTHKQFEDENSNLYRVLGKADCLITDYSSVYFDYLLLNRPIGFALSDIDEYGGDRGFVFDDPRENMPGVVFVDGEGMLSFVSDTFQGKDVYAEKRIKMNTVFNRYHDGENCRRAIEAVGIKELR